MIITRVKAFLLYRIGRRILDDGLPKCDSDFYSSDYYPWYEAVFCKIPVHLSLGPSINGLVNDRNAKICCRGFILALF